MTLDLEQSQNLLSEAKTQSEESEQTLKTILATSESGVTELNRKIGDRDAKISELDSQLESLRSEMKSRREEFLVEKSDLASKLDQTLRLHVSFCDRSFSYNYFSLGSLHRLYTNYVLIEPVMPQKAKLSLHFLSIRVKSTHAPP